jgi:hypothetical protein
LEIIEASPLQPLYPLFSLVRSGGFLSFLLSLERRVLFEKNQKAFILFSLLAKKKRSKRETKKRPGSEAGCGFS